MNRIKKSLHLLLAVLIAAAMLCGAAWALDAAGEDIVILFTNDVHCGIEDDIGYSGLAAYKKSVEERTPYVTLVDCGDALQGGFIGTISKGAYVVQIMNQLGYDLAVPGNHEFDYGMEQLAARMEASNAQYLACNVDYSGSGDSALSSAKPYEILEYGDTAVAFIGVTTPECITKSTPSYFMEDGAYVYSFAAGENGQLLYDRVQGYVDECRTAGADYVVVLSHLGDMEESSPYTSVELIGNTVGIDAVLDGHAHNVIPCRVLENREGEMVLLGSAGTKLDNIGQLVISAGGYVSVGLISGYDGKDAAFDAFYSELKAEFEDDMNRVVATSDTALSISDDSGLRMVRNRETAIGNFCADAYRTVTGADVAFVNGGGIRADLPAGDILYSDVLAMHPYGNSICMVKATGQEILDCLEVSCMDTQPEASADGRALGENGSFQSVSGLRYTIDTAVSSPVVFDENGMLLSVDGERRAKNVEILGADGEYHPIDPQGEYTVASHNYLIRESGGGINVFADNELLISEGMSDYQAVLTYITEYLHGELGGLYAGPEGRILVQ